MTKDLKQLDIEQNIVTNEHLKNGVSSADSSSGHDMDAGTEETATSVTVTKKRPFVLLAFAALGPGFIAAMAGNDAGGISTFSVAGSHFGYVHFVVYSNRNALPNGRAGICCTHGSPNR